MDAKDDIKQRLNVEEVIGEYLELKPAGRNLKALSPFNSEKTPSFMVSPDKQIWHDFSTNKGGDIFTFVMEVEGVDFVGALEILARKAGVDLSQYRGNKSTGSGKLKERLLKAHELAAQYYHACLSKNVAALAYVKDERKLTVETIRTFRLGYAPQDGTSLVNFLQKRGFKADELIKAGLATNRYGGLKDLFRGRLMVPLADGQGNVIGFTGRIFVDNPKAPKYLNTPQSPLYDKGRHVFGLHLAREAIRQHDYTVVVEGNMDVIGSHQAGVAQVVATAGTAMTTYHLQTLKRLSPNIKLCFDSDRAGQAATERAIGLAQQVQANLYIITLPDGVKDPDELAMKDSAAWQQAIDKSQYVIDWVLRYYQTKYDLQTAPGKRDYSNQIIEVLRKLNDPVEQSHYIDKLAKILSVSQDSLQRKLVRGTKTTERKAIRATPSEADPSVYQDNLLALGLAFTEARQVFENMSDEYFDGEDRQALAKYLVTNFNKNSKISIKNLPIDDNYAKILLFKAEQQYTDLSSQERLDMAYDIKRRLLTQARKKQQQILTQQIRAAENAGDSDMAEQLLQEYQKLLKA